MPKKPITHESRFKKGNKPKVQIERDKAWKKKAFKTKEEALPDKIRSSDRWRRVRDLCRSLHPLCSDPFDWHLMINETKPAEQVHHIKSLRKAPELAFTMSNLAPVCADCHHRIESAEKSGKDTTHMFGGFIRKMLRKYPHKYDI
jgi:5-methylcytosine-specific restriction endonuclease McrA